MIYILCYIIVYRIIYARTHAHSQTANSHEPSSNGQDETRKLQRQGASKIAPPFQVPVGKLLRVHVEAARAPQPPSRVGLGLFFLLLLLLRPGRPPSEKRQEAAPQNADSAPRAGPDREKVLPRHDTSKARPSKTSLSHLRATAALKPSQPVAPAWAAAHQHTHTHTHTDPSTA